MEAGSRKYLYKLDWFHALRRAMQVEREKNDRVVLAGDFNIAPADADLWNPQTWPDKILTTAPERTALERLLSDGFVDAFRAFPQKEKQFSWWDYRMAAYERNHGLRIDLMLASDALRPMLKACQLLMSNSHQRKEGLCPLFALAVITLDYARTRKAQHS